MDYFTYMHDLMAKETSHSFALSLEDRNTLIEWYIDSLEDMGAVEEEITDTEEYLRQLGNPQLISDCVDFMPECLQDLRREK